jgi:serine O-acetyltransferase
MAHRVERLPNMGSACACEGRGLARTVREDVDRYVYEVERDGRRGFLALVRVLLLSPGLWALLQYRVAHQALMRVRPRSVGAMLARLLQLLQIVVRAVTQIEIDPRAHIGPGLMIPHSGTLVIGPVRLGAHCNVFQGATLGSSTTESDLGHLATPVLDDRVWVGPGAVLAGALHIGADASIGANSVVMRDVPPRGVVLGVPSRLVSRQGSFKQITYRGQEQDPGRGTAMQETDTQAPHP